MLRIRESKVEEVVVRTGVSIGTQVEVFGKLAAGDIVALRGTDELRAGTKVTAKEAK